MTPSAAATESTQDSTVSGVVVVRPNVVCSQTWPLSVNQTSARCRPIAATTIRSSAMPADFSRILRNGGENIWASALNAASSMSCNLCARHCNPARTAPCRGGLRARSGSGNVPRCAGDECRHVETDAPIVPRRRRRHRGGPGARRDPAEKGRAAPGEPRSGIDVVIVGAGAAGIAAARRVIAAGRKCVVLEAARRGRRPLHHRYGAVRRAYDRGARWLHTPETNPVARLATQTGFDIYPAPPGQRMRIARRYARESEMEDMLSTMVRANTAIADAARKTDIAAAQALPKDLGEWRSTVEFMLGPYFCGKDLSEVSAADLARAAERDVQAFCRQGLGAVVAKLAADLPVRLSTPATRINWGGRAGVEVETAQGTIDARAAIVTASTNVLTAGKIRFTPDLPKRQLDAIERLKLGSYDHVTLELAGNPLGLRTDELVFEKAAEPAHRRAARQHVGQHAVHGRCRRPLRARARRQGRQGDGRLRARLARQSLRRRLKRAAGRSHATRLERGALGARRDVGGGAGRAVCAPQPDGADQQPHLVCGRGGA